jgi:hypothetical protein
VICGTPCKISDSFSGNKEIFPATNKIKYRSGMNSIGKRLKDDNGRHFLWLGKSSEPEIGSTNSLAWLEHIYLVGVICGAVRRILNPLK